MTDLLTDFFEIISFAWICKYSPGFWVLQILAFALTALQRQKWLFCAASFIFIIMLMVVVSDPNNSGPMGPVVIPFLGAAACIFQAPIICYSLLLGTINIFSFLLGKRFK